MDKKQYLDELALNLKGLPADEVREILQDYEEHFRMGLERGKTEEEVAARLGAPKALASAFLMNSSLGEEDFKEMSAMSMAMMTLRGIGMLLLMAPFNFLMFCGPVLIIACFLFVGWVMIASGLLVSLTGYFEFLTVDSAVELSQYTNLSLLFMFLAVIGTCGMAIILLGHLTRQALIGLLNYLQWNFNVITNRTKGSFV